MYKKYINIIILAIAMTLVVSGCAKKTAVNKTIDEGDDNKITTSTTQTDIDKSEETPEIITSDIDTSDWQTYRNEEYGFEFKYPKNWVYEISESGFVQFKDHDNMVYYEGSEIYLVGISVIKPQNDFDIENWKELKIKRKGSVRDIKIGNLSGIKTIDYLSTDVVIEKDEKRYKLTKPNVGPPSLNDIFYGLLNSWKFID